MQVHPFNRYIPVNNPKFGTLYATSATAEAITLREILVVSVLAEALTNNSSCSIAVLRGYRNSTDVKMRSMHKRNFTT